MVIKKSATGMEVVLDMGKGKNNPVYGWTTDYSIFQFARVQRDEGKRPKLEESMTKWEYLAPYPLHCVRGRNGKYIVKGGQGRLITAIKLGLAVIYCVSTDMADVAELELATMIWRLVDYLHGHIRDEKQPYQVIEQIQKKFDMQLGPILKMLSGEVEKYENLLIKFKTGNFQIQGTEIANKVGEFVVLVRDTLGHRKIAKVNAFVMALNLVLRIPQVNQEQLRKKLITYSRTLDVQKSTADYVKMLEAVYNRKTPAEEQVAIVFLASQVKKDATKKKPC